MTFNPPTTTPANVSQLSALAYWNRLIAGINGCYEVSPAITSTNLIAKVLPLFLGRLKISTFYTVCFTFSAFRLRATMTVNPALSLKEQYGPKSQPGRNNSRLTLGMFQQRYVKRHEIWHKPHIDNETWLFCGSQVRHRALSSPSTC
jgi:hypothetical protein